MSNHPLRDQIGQARAERERECQERIRKQSDSNLLFGTLFGISLTLLIQFLFRGL